MRNEMERPSYESVRGNFKYGNNHVPIQNFYLQDVVKDADGQLVAQNRRHHRQGQPGPLPRQAAR